MNAVPARELSDLQRPSGGFAMLAIDQREAMRAMFSEHMAESETASDELVSDFKVSAARVLTPLASAVLVDRQFALARFLSEPIVDPGCAIIAAADEFIPGPGEFVADVQIDRSLDLESLRIQGVKALKLLVIHRPDGDRQVIVDMVQEFTELCRGNGLISIIEPVAKAPRDGRDWNWQREVVIAAEYLGNLGAQLYKSEVPLHGVGTDEELLSACQDLHDRISSPWVVLSSGVDADLFPRAVSIACEAGASGFLAGRAVWRNCIAPSGYARCLETSAVNRLRLLGETVDAALARR